MVVEVIIKLMYDHCEMTSLPSVKYVREVAKGNEDWMVLGSGSARFGMVCVPGVCVCGGESGAGWVPEGVEKGRGGSQELGGGVEFLGGEGERQGAVTGTNELPIRESPA